MGRRRAIAYDPNNKNRGKGRRRGKISVDVDATDITGSVTFYGAPTPPDNGYIITSDSNTRLGISTNSATPIFWTADDSTIVNVVDGLPGNTTNITTTSQAFQYLADNNYYVMGPSNTETPTDKLIFEVDARRVDSYPTTGNKWYDISPNSDVMNYTYNNSNIEYEDATKSMFRTVLKTQADHYRSEDTYDIDGDFTMIVLAKVYQCHNGTANGLLTNHSHAHNTGAGITVKTITNDADFRISCNTGNGSSRTYHTYYGTSNIKDRWCHLMVHYSGTTLSLWVNGVKEYTRTYSMASRADNIDLFNWSTTYNSNSNYRPKCKIQYGQVYEKALANAEISQSYYQANIVTDGLELALDAGNLVSYESGSTKTYSLAGNVTGSFNNGVAYSHDFGGTFVFDGSNDYITLNKNLITEVGGIGSSTEYTLEAWIYVESSQGTTTNADSIIGHTSATGFGMQVGISGGKPRINYGARSTSNFYSSTFEYNEWKHVVLSRKNTSNYCFTYLDGKFDGHGGTRTLQINSPADGDLTIGHSGGRITGYFDGKIAVVRVYKKALSADEVMQNFNAQKSRFGL
jgi:hypothetical protein